MIFATFETFGLIFAVHGMMVKARTVVADCDFGWSDVSFDSEYVLIFLPPYPFFTTLTRKKYKKN